MIRRHLQERIQLLSMRRNEKLKLMVEKQKLSQLSEQGVVATELQLTSQMNFESQEENCTLIGKQIEEDKKALKRKLWTNPKELIATRNWEASSKHQEAASSTTRTGPKRQRTAPVTR